MKGSSLAPRTGHGPGNGIGPVLPFIVAVGVGIGALNCPQGFKSVEVGTSDGSDAEEDAAAGAAGRVPAVGI